MSTPTSKTLTSTEQASLLAVLKARFEANPHRHPDLRWKDVLTKLETSPDKLRSLHQMESTGGEPDVVSFDEPAFVDCSPESPTGRRSLCYDRQAQLSRRANAPANSALNLAETMGIEILTETQYRQLQNFGTFDTKTSSWIQTPAEIRKLGGALFCDRRYDTVFLYHNGAESYYAARGFRGMLKL